MLPYPFSASATILFHLGLLFNIGNASSIQSPLKRSYSHVLLICNNYCSKLSSLTIFALLCDFIHSLHCLSNTHTHTLSPSSHSTLLLLCLYTLSSLSLFTLSSMSLFVFLSLFRRHRSMPSALDTNTLKAIKGPSIKSAERGRGLIKCGHGRG